MVALRTFVLAAVLLAIAAPAASAGGPKGEDASEAMIEKINATRASHGLAALKQAPRLSRSSSRYARRLMKVDGFGHGSSYKKAGFRHAAEILAYSRGWRTRPAPVVGMWLASSTHRSLVLSGSFDYVGASPARGRLGGGLSTIWVVHFGAH